MQIGDTDYHLRCLMMIGTYELFSGKHHAGLSTLADFASVATKNDPSILPEGDVHTGIAELFLGRLPSARRRLESLQRRDLRYFGSYVIRYLSDPVILVRSVLTQVLWLTGSVDNAMRTAAAALDRAHQIQHHLSLNNILSYGCPIFYWSGQYQECDRWVAMLDESVARHGLVSRRPVANFYRAALGHTRADPSYDAVGGLERAIEEFREINHLARMPWYLSVLADALVHRDRLGEAETTIQSALDIAREQHEGWCLPEVLRVRASIHAARNQTDEAEALLSKSMELARDVGALSWRLRAANDLATLWCARSRTEDARQMLAPIYSEFTEGFATRDLMVAAALIDARVPPRSTGHTDRQFG